VGVALAVGFAGHQLNRPNLGGRAPKSALQASKQAGRPAGGSEFGGNVIRIHHISIGHRDLWRSRWLGLFSANM